MFSEQSRFFSRWVGLLGLAAMLSLIPDGRASAQSIAGHFIGENRLKLENVTWQNSFAAYVDGTLNAANGVKVSITSEKSTERLVRLEAAWDGRGLSQLAYFSDFRFGKTTLAAIRQRFGNFGIMPASGSPVVSTSDGGVAISSFYEVADSAVVATFVTKISRSGLIDLKRRYGADAYAHMATVATLHSVALSDISYFETLRGTTSVVDVGYRPIVWQPTDNMAAGRKRLISLARIKPAQLPVARIYSGPRNPPDLGGQSATLRNYQDKITSRMAEGPAFAGELAVIQIDCGARCSNAYVGNVRTGEVFKLPVGGRANLDLTLKYELSSRLMTAQWSDSESGECVIQFYGFDDGEWIELLKHKVGASDQCLTSLSQNLR